MTCSEEKRRAVIVDALNEARQWIEHDGLQTEQRRQMVLKLKRVLRLMREPAPKQRKKHLAVHNLSFPTPQAACGQTVHDPKRLTSRRSLVTCARCKS